MNNLDNKLKIHHSHLEKIITPRPKGVSNSLNNHNLCTNSTPPAIFRINGGDHRSKVNIIDSKQILVNDNLKMIIGFLQFVM